MSVYFLVSSSDSNVWYFYKIKEGFNGKESLGIVVLYNGSVKLSFNPEARDITLSDVELIVKGARMIASKNCCSAFTVDSVEESKANPKDNSIVNFMATASEVEVNAFVKGIRAKAGII